MIICLRSALVGLSVIAAFIRVDGATRAHHFNQIPPSVCPILGAIISGYTLCSGDHTTDLSISTDDNTLDIEFVWFHAPQTGAAVYAGGTVLGKISSSAFTGAGPYLAVLNDVIFPSVTVSDTFYVYARLSLADPDLTDLTCRPYLEIVVKVNPLPIANAGPDVAICPGGGTQLSASGGAVCQWSPADGLNNPDTCFPVASPFFTTVYTVTTTSVFGCMASDDVTVILHDPAGMVCNDNVIIGLEQNGKILIVPDMILEGSDIGLDVYSITIQTLTGQPIANPLTCAHIGQTLQVKVTDTCNGNTCWSTVAVEDKLPPVLVCTDTIVPCAVSNFSPNYLSGTLGIASANPKINDNCEINTVVFNDIWETVACGDTVDGKMDIAARLLRKWTAVDVYGNKSSCEQRIYLNRRHINALIFPADTVVSCENPLTDPTFTGAPYFTDFDVNFPINGNNLCDLSIKHEDEFIPVCDGTLHIKRTWTAIDWCLPDSLLMTGANPAVFTQMIKVIDDRPPSLMCPADFIVTTDPLSCCAAVDLPDVLLSDNCSRLNNIGAMVAGFDFFTNQPIGMFSVSGNLGDFSGNNYWLPDTLGLLGSTPCLPRGAHIVTYTAEDDCGNSATCSYILTVSDLTPPEVACVEYTKVALGVSGTTLTDASSFNAASYDNCSSIYLKARRMDPNDCQSNKFLYDQVKFCCEDTGDTITIVLRVSDYPLPPGELSLDFETQNYNECMVRVLVEDKVKPTCMPPANVTVSCESFDFTLETYGFAVAADNCCFDTITESVSYALFDTVCNKGTIVRTFLPIDCASNASSCTQRIIVDYKQDYWIKFPDDKIVKICDGVTDFGAPIFNNKDCELMGVSYEDVVYNVVTDACYKIERTWNIINWCTYNPNEPCIEVPNPDIQKDRPFMLPGPIVSPIGTVGAWAPTVVKVVPSDSLPTNYSTFWDPDANCYRYKQIIVVEDTKDPAIANCPKEPQFCDLTNNDSKLWNATYWLDPATDSQDRCEGETDLTLTASDFCTGTNLNFKYLLLLDLDNDGTTETVVNGNNPPTPGTVDFGNATSPNFIGGAPRIYDQRPIPLPEKWNFALQTSLSGSSVTAAVRWNTIANPTQFVVPQLPYGTHKIKWIVEDGCGNESYCEYSFNVKDCKPPTVVCHDGLSTSLMPTQMAQLWATDFLQYALDNCTPPTATTPGPNLLKFAIVKSSASTGAFPIDLAGSPLTNVLFTCDDLGEQSVQLWAQDLAGNADYCETTLTIQDNSGHCTNDTYLEITGKIATEAQEGVDGANVHLQYTPISDTPLHFYEETDQQGYFSFHEFFHFPASCVLTPNKNDNPLNGVSTFDLVLISRHILGLQPLGSPYKMIAADANRSNSITTFDIVELRKLILGIYSELPSNSAWRFIDKNFAFPQSTNPFAAPFPETVMATNPQDVQDLIEFIAVKTGDVNGTVIPNFMSPADDRSVGTFLFEVNDRTVETGETFLVKFKPAERVQGWQFTLNFNDLEILEIQPGAGMTAQNFALFTDAITSSVDGEAGEFSLKCRALRPGRLSQMFAVSNRITRAEAYRQMRDEHLPNLKSSEGWPQIAKQGVALRFNNENTSVVAGVGFELYPCQPNPFVGQTAVSFHLPEAAEARLTVFDELGKAVFFKKDFCPEGYSRVLLDLPAMGATRVLYCKLEAAEYSAVLKMVKLD